MAGKFISVEGIEGAGKTTVAAELADRLGQRGLWVDLFREPGSTPAGETLRALLKDGTVKLSPFTEVLLFEAARHELVVQRIRPALAVGRWVIVDRFYDSTTAYQGYGRGLDLEMLATMHQWACGETSPDLTLLLDVEPSIGLNRARVAGGYPGNQGGDRYEAEGESFLARVRTGFLRLAEKERGRIAVVRGTGSVGEVVEECMGVVEKRLGLNADSGCY